MLDPADLTKGSVNVTIDVASIDTNEPARDKHLRSDDFVVENYPKIMFQPTRVRKAGDKKLQIDGHLSMHGITKPVTLDKDLVEGGGLMVGDDVDIILSVEAIRQKQPQPAEETKGR